MLLLPGAEHHDGIRPEQVEVDGRRTGHAGPGPCDGVSEYRSLRDAEPGSAIFTRHGDAEPASLRDGVHECLGKLAVRVAGQPISVVEIVANAGDGASNGRLFLCQFKIHLIPQF